MEKVQTKEIEHKHLQFYNNGNAIKFDNKDVLNSKRRNRKWETIYCKDIIEIIDNHSQIHYKDCSGMKKLYLEIKISEISSAKTAFSLTQAGGLFIGAGSIIILTTTDTFTRNDSFDDMPKKADDARFAMQLGYALMAVGGFFIAMDFNGQIK